MPAWLHELLTNWLVPVGLVLPVAGLLYVVGSRLDGTTAPTRDPEPRIDPPSLPAVAEEPAPATTLHGDLALVDD